MNRLIELTLPDIFTNSGFDTQIVSYFDEISQKYTNIRPDDILKLSVDSSVSIADNSLHILNTKHVCGLSIIRKERVIFSLEYDIEVSRNIHDLTALTGHTALGIIKEILIPIKKKLRDSAQLMASIDEIANQSNLNNWGGNYRSML